MRFRSIRASQYGPFWSLGEDSPVDHYLVWPASDAVVAIEREQCEVFGRWNQRREGAGGRVRFDDGERYRLGGLGQWVRWTRAN